MPYIMIRPEDVRHIAITCRCGLKGMAELPQQVASQVNLHFCAACNTAYEITYREGKWIIRRSPDFNQTGNVVESRVMHPTDGVEYGLEQDCQFCKGTGQQHGARCGKCDGRGRQKGRIN